MRVFFLLCCLAAAPVVVHATTLDVAATTTPVAAAIIVVATATAATTTAIIVVVAAATTSAAVLPLLSLHLLPRVEEDLHSSLAKVAKKPMRETGLGSIPMSFALTRNKEALRIRVVFDSNMKEVGGSGNCVHCTMDRVELGSPHQGGWYLVICNSTVLVSGNPRGQVVDGAATRLPTPQSPPPSARGVGRKQIAMVHPQPVLKAVTLTHVRYRRGDPLGHFLAWVSLIPVFISLGGFVSHFLFRRELQGMFFALGLLLSQVLNELVKTSVQQSRPETCAALEMCDSHGWPSSHSQYMFFFAVYFTLLAFRGVGVSSRACKAFVAFLPWPPTLLTMYSRVYLGYHTVAQVVAGATLGIVLGALWYWVVNSMLIDYFPAIEESAFGRFFYIKDSSHIPNVLKFEYDNARASRKKAD
ncbi:hypothetical protein Taro_015077 [Colocasia esculenta]|uniref:Phosphatidic acid phosphatase type 2/haloperoxidase domain-containing protein n=1 Tax=Colocasia esculenta TaxID=4460 RepID=A0A843UKF5_COLES|nr:hypothetical protein [Colocasia esculenta]